MKAKQAPPPDDDDMGATWRAIEKFNQEKRASNRKASAKILTDAGISFVSANDGAHLIIKTKQGVINFWPGTGLFMSAWSTKKQRGVKNLVKLLNAGGEP